MTPAVPEAPSIAAGTSAAVAATRRVGDVTTMLKSQRFNALAWDDADAVLIGTQYSAPPVVLTGHAAVQLPPQAAGVAYDAPDKTFFFSSQSSIYASRIGGSLKTVTQSLTNATTMTADKHGTIYVIDGDHIDRLRKGRLDVYAFPGTVTAPNGSYGNALPSLAFDEDNGTLYLADTYSDTIKRIVNHRGVVVAGHCLGEQSSPSGCRPGNVPGKGAAALFGTIGGIAYDPQAKDLIVADAQQNVLWRITTGGVATVAAGYGPPGTFDGNGLRAFFASPACAVTAPRLDSVIVSDTSRVAAYAYAGKPAPAFDPPTKRFVLPGLPVLASNPAAIGDAAWVEYAGRAVEQHADGRVASYKLAVDGLNVNPMIAVDPHGNVWAQFYIPFGTSTIGLLELDSAHKLKRYNAYPLNSPSNMTALSIGPDGNPWFAIDDGFSDYLETVRDGSVVHLAAPRAQSISAGPNGTILLGGYDKVITEFDTSGKRVGEIPAKSGAGKIAYDRKSGDVWFLDSSFSGRLYRVSRAHRTYEYDVPYNVYDLGVAPDDTAWIPTGNGITSVSPAGTLHDYYLPSAVPGATYVDAGSAGVWISAVGQIFLLDPALYRRDHFPYAP